MGLFDDRNTYIGIGLGLLTAGVVKEVAPAFRGLGRPLAKATIKSGMTLYEKGREKAAQFGEVFEDLMAEIKAEKAEELRQQAASVGTPPEAEAGSVQ